MLYKYRLNNIDGLGKIVSGLFDVENTVKNDLSLLAWCVIAL